MSNLAGDKNLGADQTLWGNISGGPAQAVPIPIAALQSSFPGTGGGGSGTAFSGTITQVGHGFAVGDVLQISGSGTYSKAKADTAANAEVVGIVIAVVDADHFKLCWGGYITGFAGLTPDVIYFLSPTTAGAITAVEPTTVGQISKPIVWADTAASGYFFNMRGRSVGGGGSMNITFGLGVPTALGSDGDLYFESYAGTMYIQSPQAELPHIVGPVQFNGFTLGTSNNYTITTPLAADCLLIALAFNANTAAEVITGTVTVNVNGQADIRAQIPVTHFTAAPITTPVQHSFGQVMYIDLNGVQLVGATINITTSVAIDHMHVYSIPLVGSNKSQIMVSSGNLPASQAVAGAGQVTAAYTMGSGLMFSLAWAANTSGTAIPAAPAGFTRIASSTYNTGGISFSTSGLDVMQVPAAFAGTVALGTHATYSYLSMQFAANGAAGSHWRAIIGL
jgi:hypothetical protein